MDTRIRGVAAYLFISFGLAWACWAVRLLSVNISPRHPLFQLLLLPGGFAPAVAAIVVRRWITREGFADAGLRLNLRKWSYYLFGLVWPLIVVLIIVLLAGVLGLGQPDFSLQRVLRVLAPGANLPELPAALRAFIPIQLLISAILVTPLLWGEEFGWRGYLQPRLFPGRPALAAVACGLIWGVWHYPLILAGYQYPDDRLAGLLVFPVSTVFLSILFGWLQARTGSVWAPSLAHAATNAVGASLTVLWFLGGPDWLLVSYVGILAWVPFGLLSAWIVARGQLGPAGHRSPVHAGPAGE